MAVMYSLYYAWQRQKPYWWAGIAFVFLYATVLIWQTYWAVATARKTAWGTRAGREDHVLPAELVAQVKKTGAGLGGSLARHPPRSP